MLPFCFSLDFACTFINLFIHLMVNERGLQRAILSVGGAALTLKVCGELPVMEWALEDSDFSIERWEARRISLICLWMAAFPLFLLGSCHIQLRKWKPSFYQPFPSESEQTINNWIQALGESQAEWYGVGNKGGVCQIANGKKCCPWCHFGPSVLLRNTAD